MEENILKEYGLKQDIIELADKASIKTKEIFENIDKVNQYNSIKVLKAFQKHNISDIHFCGTTGYGYGDIGRDTTEKVFADILKAEDCLVRGQLISGTHALTVTLFGLLRPNDTLLSITGTPYDTLHEVIGIKENHSSLKSFGINYEQIDLKDDKFDIEAIVDRVEQGNVKVIAIQRSKGYSTRKSIDIDSLENIVNNIRRVNKNVIIMIDNCYCEFVTTKEPLEVGADLIVGSLIKNLGGGIAPNGAYIAGKKELVELVAERLTSPGSGKEVGPSLGITKYILQGIYMSPEIVASSLKTAVFASSCLEDLGYDVSPKFNEKRADIVQTINFNDSEKLIKYCQGIQAGSAIDSMSVPEPWDMPGYSDKVIMASRSFYTRVINRIILRWTNKTTIYSFYARRTYI